MKMLVVFSEDDHMAMVSLVKDSINEIDRALGIHYNLTTYDAYLVKHKLTEEGDWYAWICNCFICNCHRNVVFWIGQVKTDKMIFVFFLGVIVGVTGMIVGLVLYEDRDDWYKG